MKLAMAKAAVLAVANTSPAQTWAFVCSSRRDDAVVVEAYISFEIARHAARRIGGCMRVGRVVDGKADTL